MQRLRSWARLHVRLSRFACMLGLLHPGIVRKTRGRDCGQRLSRKGARPLASALPHTVHQGIEATTPDDTRGGNAKISTCTVVSNGRGKGGGATSSKTWPLVAILAESRFRQNACTPRSRLYQYPTLAESCVSFNHSSTRSVRSCF